jgi:hypothetical protein
MSIFKKRNILVGIGAFIIGLFVVGAIWGVSKFFTRSTTVKSQVTAYLLDDRGAVNGLLLASGDQLHFSPQTGEAVVAQVKVGDEVTATGHAGSRSTYGREVRISELSANGRTFVEAEPDRPRPPGDRDRRGPRRPDDGPDDRRAPPDATAPAEVKPEASATPAAAPAKDANAKPAEAAPAATAPTAVAPATAPPVAPAPPEIFKGSGTIRTHLVNGRGDVTGLILSSGEQVHFSPKVGTLIIAAEQGAETQVTVEGRGVRNERGTVISPAQITVGNQTITLGDDRGPRDHPRPGRD